MRIDSEIRIDFSTLIVYNKIRINLFIIFQIDLLNSNYLYRRIAQKLWLEEMDL